jgi:hypothetical protein
VFRREGETWLVVFNGATARLRHTKGMGDLACLLARDGAEVHVLDLVAEGPVVVSGSVGDQLDDTARRQYEARLEEIEEDLADADARADVAASERLHRERDALLAELSAAYGLGGRSRRRGDSAERARSTVTQRTRDAIARIADAHPELGRHLRSSVKTGTFCAYIPESPVSWEL